MTTAVIAVPHPTARVCHRGLYFGRTVEVLELHPRRSAGAIDSATVLLVETGRPCRRCVLSSGDLEPLPIPPTNGREYFNAVAEDFWVCPCGNSPSGSGLHLTYRDGTEPGDEAGEGWTRDGGCYCCADCGRIGAQCARDVMGRIPVIGRAAALPTGEAPAAGHTA